MAQSVQPDTAIQVTNSNYTDNMLDLSSQYIEPVFLTPTLRSIGRSGCKQVEFTAVMPSVWSTDLAKTVLLTRGIQYRPQWWACQLWTLLDCNLIQPSPTTNPSYPTSCRSPKCHIQLAQPSTYKITRASRVMSALLPLEMACYPR